MSSLKSFFVKQQHTEDSRTTESDDYAVTTTRREDIALRILSILGALIIWVAIVIGDSGTKYFDSIQVTATGGSDLRKEYVVEYAAMEVSVSIQGKATQISQINVGDVKVYVDLSAAKGIIEQREQNASMIGEDGSKVSHTIELPLIYSLTDQKKKEYGDVVFIQKSKESITVTFTKK